MDGLSTGEVAEYEALVAKGESGMEELKQFVNDKVFCRQHGKPANFADGNHYTCPTEGGKRKRMRKTKRRLRHKKSKKTKRRSKMGGKSKKRKGKKSRKSKKSKK